VTDRQTDGQTELRWLRRAAAVAAAARRKEMVLLMDQRLILAESHYYMAQTARTTGPSKHAVTCQKYMR